MCATAPPLGWGGLPHAFSSLAPLTRSFMSRLTRCLRFALLVVAAPVFGQSVTVSLPAPPVPTVHVIAPAPVVVEHTTVVQPVVVQQGKGNRGKHKGQNK